MSIICDLAKMRKYLPYVAIVGAALLSTIGIYLAFSMLAPGVDEGKVLQSEVYSRLTSSQHY